MRTVPSSPIHTVRQTRGPVQVYTPEKSTDQLLPLWQSLIDAPRAAGHRLAQRATSRTAPMSPPTETDPLPIWAQTVTG
jgi:hypothetical protein